MGDLCLPILQGWGRNSLRARDSRQVGSSFTSLIDLRELVKDRNDSLGEASTWACSQDEENVRLQGVRSDLVVPRPLGAKQIRMLVHSM